MKAVFSALFRKNQGLSAAEDLFASATDLARNPAFYQDMGVPDTLEGRFEMTVLSVWLILRRLQGDDERAKDVSQKLFDAMFASFDDALRELGVGDLVVGKRIKKLAENFYGRVKAYEEALAGDAGEDNDAFATALARNVYLSDDAAAAKGLAAYARQAVRSIDGQELSALIEGRVAFPEAP